MPQPTYRGPDGGTAKRRIEMSNPESPLSAAAAVPASSYARHAGNDAGKSTTSSPPVARKVGAVVGGASADDSAMIITPVKAVPEKNKEVAKGKKRQHTQLQLAIVKKKSSSGGSHDIKNNENSGGSNQIVLKTLQKKKKTVESTRDAERGAPTSVVKWPPVASAKSLPPLAGRIADLAEERTATGGTSRYERSNEFTAKGTIEFDVNQECTSIGLVPSGRIAVAGFTDGTLRLFDLTGVFSRDRNDPRESLTKGTFDFDDDASTSSSDDSFDFQPDPNSQARPNSAHFAGGVSKIGKGGLVDSYTNQRYGAVACQIYARGVHTSLLMDVAVSEDGLFAFGGVQRGSVELAAVYLGDLEAHLDDMLSQPHKEKDDANENQKKGILNLIKVDRHADAKLKGFGACTRLWNGWERARSGERPEYLLFTGKGIKNIHIWSFKPSHLGKESVWSCLYDTQTNGTSINQLYFRYSAAGALQAISKSDDQKLRVWDLSFEQERITGKASAKDRPKRPSNYIDVVSTESTIMNGVIGPYAFTSGALGEAYNVIKIVSLEGDISSPFNCTELALPQGDSCMDLPLSNRPSRSGRQQRGELKSVDNVAGLTYDGSVAVLEISDGSVLNYLHDESGHPILERTPAELCKTSIDIDIPTTVAPFGGPPTAPHISRRVCLARVGAEGMILLAVSSFNENATRGALMFRRLPLSAIDVTATKAKRFWGFDGLKRRRKSGTNEPVFDVLSNKSALSNGPVKPSSNQATVSPVPLRSVTKRLSTSSASIDAAPANSSRAHLPKVNHIKIQPRPRSNTFTNLDISKDIIMASPPQPSRNEDTMTDDGTPSSASNTPIRNASINSPNHDSPDVKSALDATFQETVSQVENIELLKLYNKGKDKVSATTIDTDMILEIRHGGGKDEDKVKAACADSLDAIPPIPMLTGNEVETSPEKPTTLKLTPDSNVQKGDVISDVIPTEKSPEKVVTEESQNEEHKQVGGGIVSNDSALKTGYATSEKDMKVDDDDESWQEERRNKRAKKSSSPQTKRRGSPYSSPERSRRSSKRVSFESSPPSPVIVDDSVNNLGITIVNKFYESKLPESCFIQRKQRQFLIDDHTKTAVSVRFPDDVPQPTLTVETSKAKSTFLKHCEERRRLAAEHRAQHEQLRKRILSSIRQVFSTMDLELASNRSHSAIAETAKRWFDEGLVQDQEILQDMLVRQTMEAEALAANHTAQLPGKRAPTLQVTFPFPEVFEQARNELIFHLEKSLNLTS
mmetsp:Transcript_25991/g.50424  ORF Transcript_25991/g.50424 Transcript_25991/m.50424 type:complete len:1257 (-) Transcript_25991:285-4055(-)